MAGGARGLGREGEEKSIGREEREIPARVMVHVARS
jgi:hypothetical protein